MACTAEAAEGGSAGVLLRGDTQWGRCSRDDMVGSFHRLFKCQGYQERGVWVYGVGAGVGDTGTVGGDFGVCGSGGEEEVA
ncbi:hypothetical protein PtrV1_04943 [Pyrenophora tritici-repentis]|nr:hypothetical protein PtrV1_04943 [Pyrenophora tritici-repentis]